MIEQLTDYLTAFENKHDFEVKLSKEKEIEFAENFFTKQNLINSNYPDFLVNDFTAYNYFLKLEYEKINSYKIDIEFSAFRKANLKEILYGTIRIPKLLYGTNEVYWVLSGEAQLLTYKVLGISPLCKIIDVEKEITKKF